MVNIEKFLPIKKDELLKFIIASSMMFLTIFVYSIQRGVKDSLVVTYLGAELISTLKLFGVLPFAILAMLFYSKLVDIFNKTTIFHLLNGIFLTYFTAFTFILHPNINALKIDLHHIIEYMPNIKYQLIMIENWSISLYYILSELWGSIMLALLFWQTCNQIFATDQAKRIYPLFGIFAQFGLIFAGMFVGISTSADLDWQTSLHFVNIAVMISGVLLSTGYWLLSNYLVDKDIINGVSGRKKKTKPGFIASMRYVFSSRYIALIAALILCYGISINLVEGVWKKQAGEIYTNPQDFLNFMGNVQIFTGIATWFAMLIGSYMLRLVSWRTAAMFTPIMIFVTGTLFFLFVIFDDYLSTYTIAYASSTMVAVCIGSAQNILSKSTKYTFFDATKEMAYIPLDEELKSKGKAAADVIGGRLGKSGGAIIQVVFLALMPNASLITLAPVLCIIFLVIMVLWLVSVNALANQYNEFVHEENDEVVKEIKPTTAINRSDSSSKQKALATA